MTVETIIPLADGTYKTGLDKEGNLSLRTQLFYSTGYWVSDDSGVTIEGHITHQGLQDAFSLMDIKVGEIVGVWTDPDTTITYIDRSYHFERKEVAIDFGNLYNQIAIWDCQAKEAINL